MALLNAGCPERRTAIEVGVSRHTIRRWRLNGRPKATLPTIEAARAVAESLDERRYGYLLGMYLGDGCISKQLRTTGLIISLDPKYEDVVDECEEAMTAVAPGTVHRYVRSKAGVVALVAYWTGWPILFPQFGPGKKHLRRIVLDDWQRMITARHTREFIRGLIHSDGSRCINRFSVNLLGGKVGRYEYPRYFFTNYSADIRRIFCEHCDLLGIRWTQSNARNISISHRDSVAILDSFVGPKS